MSETNAELIEAAMCAAVDYELRGHDAMSKMMVKVADALEAHEAETARRILFAPLVEAGATS